MRLFFSVVLLAFSANAASMGDVCTHNGQSGVCVDLVKCPIALDELNKNQRPTICGFVASEPIVCCVSSTTTSTTTTTTTTTTSRPVLTTEKHETISTTTYVPKSYDYSTLEDTSPESCEPLPTYYAPPKNGKKAWDKCLEYQEKTIFLCKRSPALGGDTSMIRDSNCNHKTTAMVLGGEDAGDNEFPHMALLGFEKEKNNISWSCGGSLISDRYVLTAGHCIADRDVPVGHVALGRHSRSDDLSGRHHYTVKNVIKHPEYKPPQKYHDIALLELDREVILEASVIPACLHMGGVLPNLLKDNATATGWGATDKNGRSLADVLQKVLLHKFNSSECETHYVPNRNMNRGLDTETQFCYGDWLEVKDTCQGDSGGPLQVNSEEIYCMWVIVGVTSFGRKCGVAGLPAIYTRVDHYVDWIVSIVWP